MTRNLKTLGLVLAVALATSALMASPASATAIKFTSDSPSGTTTIVGEQAPNTNDVFTTTAGSIECANTHYTSTQIGASATSLTVTPTYSSCTAFGFAGAIFNPKSCVYVFHAGTKIASGATEGSADIECSGNDKMDVDVGLFGTQKCTVTIGAQTNIAGSITWTHGVASSKTDITVDINLSDVHYEEHGGTGFGACGDSTTTLGGGTLQGTGTWTGFNTVGGARVNISVD